MTKKWKWSKTFQNCIWLLPRCTTTSYMGAIDEELWENLWKTSSKWKGIYLWLSMAVWCLPHRLPVFPDFKKKDIRASTATTRKELQSPSSKMSQVSCLFRIVFWMFLTVFYWHVLFVARHLHVTKPGHFTGPLLRTSSWRFSGSPDWLSHRCSQWPEPVGKMPEPMAPLSHPKSCFCDV